MEGLIPDLSESEIDLLTGKKIEQNAAFASGKGPKGAAGGGGKANSRPR